MNEVQINKIKKRADEYATSCFPYEEQFLEREAVVKCCVLVVTEIIAELEKENAELKQRNAELKGMYAHSAREAGSYKQFFEKMKSDVMSNIKWADQNKNNQMYCKLNAMFNQWEITEK